MSQTPAGDYPAYIWSPNNGWYYSPWGWSDPSASQKLLELSAKLDNLLQRMAALEQAIWSQRISQWPPQPQETWPQVPISPTCESVTIHNEPGQPVWQIVEEHPG